MSIDNSLVAPDDTSERSFFYGVIACVTILPILFVMIAAPYRGQTTTIDGVFSVLLLMSTMHVGLSSFFYTDREYRQVVRDKWKYYLAFPAIIIIAAGLVTSTFPKNGIIYTMMFYHAWLLYHYGRQNYGILSFVASSSQTGRLNRLEKTALHLVPTGGILGSYSVLSQAKKSIFSGQLDSFWTIGAVLTTIGILCALIAAVSSYKKHNNLQRPFFLILMSLFYLPTFFFSNYTQAILSYAIAHALQYFVFMTFLAGGSREQTATHTIIVLFLTMIFVWCIILLTREKTIWGSFQPFMAGAALGLIMWHFVMDAGFWKLSVPWQRKQVQRRMSFLFSK